MSLPEEIQKIKGFFRFHEGNLGTILHVLLLLGIGSGGYLIGLESQKSALGEGNTGVAVFSDSAQTLPTERVFAESINPATTPIKKEGSSTGAFVASLKGTKYHRLDCSGAKTIKEENRVYFDSEQAAQKAGYAPAGNCPGLQ